MCYISDWPKRFLKTVLLQLSRHQVCKKHSRLWTTRGSVCVLVLCEKRSGSWCLLFAAGGVSDWEWSWEGLPLRCPSHVSPVSNASLHSVYLHSLHILHVSLSAIYKELELCCHFCICASWFLAPSNFLVLSRFLIACRVNEKGVGWGGARRLHVSMNLFTCWLSLWSVSTVLRQAWPVIYKSPFSCSPSKRSWIGSDE